MKKILNSSENNHKYNVSQKRFCLPATNSINHRLFFAQGSNWPKDGPKKCLKCFFNKKMHNFIYLKYPTCLHA
jgi:hypothetical protein